MDAAELAAATQRYTKRLLDATSGCKTLTLSVIKTPPGEGSPEGLHTHTVDQIFYVVSGVMSIEVEGHRDEAGPGSLIVFPAEIPHRNWNGGTEPTVHLSIATPIPDPSVPFAKRVTT